MTKGRKNDLPQLASASCGKSFQRVMVTRYKELWQLVTATYSNSSRPIMRPIKNGFRDRYCKV